MWLSVIISVITAAFIYLALNSLFVRPMRRITRSMLRFSENPEDPERIIVPSARHDEVGTAERELASMQKQLSQMLLQKNRLAQLGLAVSKINHDLRNMLANAQLISDRLTSVPDPTVQTFAPKLIASLDRAINFCTDSLRFGRAEEAAPRRELMLLKPLVEDVGDALFLPREDQIGFAIDMEDTLRIDADREQLFRILSNLVRNAVQAIESQEDDAKGEIRIAGRREGRKVFVEVCGRRAGRAGGRAPALFRAFQGSFRKGGTGLGLAIALELVGRARRHAEACRHQGAGRRSCWSCPTARRTELCCRRRIGCVRAATGPGLWGGGMARDWRCGKRLAICGGCD